MYVLVTPTRTQTGSLTCAQLPSDLIDLLLPPAYTSRVRNALAASADSVNLRNLGGGGGAFYAGGARLNKVWVSHPLFRPLFVIPIAC